MGECLIPRLAAHISPQRPTHPAHGRQRSEKLKVDVFMSNQDLKVAVSPLRRDESIVKHVSLTESATNMKPTETKSNTESLHLHDVLLRQTLAVMLLQK